MPDEINQISCMFEALDSTEFQRRNCQQYVSADPVPEPVYLYKTLAKGAKWEAGGLAEFQGSEGSDYHQAMCRCHKADYSEGISVCNKGCGDPTTVCNDDFGCAFAEKGCDANKCSCKPLNISSDTMTY